MHQENLIHRYLEESPATAMIKFCMLNLKLPQNLWVKFFFFFLSLPFWNDFGEPLTIYVKMQELHCIVNCFSADSSATANQDFLVYILQHFKPFSSKEMLFAQKLLNYSTWWVADKLVCFFFFPKMETLFLILLSGLLFYLPSHKVSGVY